MRQRACRMVLIAAVALVSAGAGGHAVLAQAAAQPAAATLQPYVVEYYYKVKWGHFEEFLELYMKNHIGDVHEGGAAAFRAADRAHGHSDQGR